MLTGNLLSHVLVLSAASSAVLGLTNKQLGWGNPNGLLRRQATPSQPPEGNGDPFVNLPPQCEQVCQPLFDYQCEAIECECTNDNAQLLGTCLNCVVGAGGPQDVAQESMDAFIQFCADNNVTVTPVEITGSSTGSTTGTGSGSGSQTPTGSGSTSGSATTQPPTTSTGTTTTGTTNTGTTGTGTTTSEGAANSENTNGAGAGFGVPVEMVAAVVGGAVLGMLGL